MCGSWEGTEGIPFICIGEERTGRRDEESDVLEGGGTRTSFFAPDVSPRKIEVGGAGLLLLFPFFLFCPFFPDASTMEAMTSPNMKSGNKLHWIRMLGWMDASTVD